MRVCEVEIRIAGFEEFKKTAVEGLGAKPSGRRVLFLEASKFHSLFTPQRLRLLKAVGKSPQAGTVALAGFLKRKQEAVSRDLSALKAAGLVAESESNSSKPQPAAISLVI